MCDYSKEEVGELLLFACVLTISSIKGRERINVMVFKFGGDLWTCIGIMPY